MRDERQMGQGIPPRFFAWIIKGHLAVSERPGGYARNHRKVRRQEEILWLRGEGFTRIVTLLPSPHNLHAYDELGVTWSHVPFGPHDDPAVVLGDLYGQLKDWLADGERLLVHQEELGDRLMGVVAGYLRWSGMVPSGPQAIAVVEKILGRQMGPAGRELVALAPSLAGFTNEPLGADVSNIPAPGIDPPDRIELRGLRALGTHGVLPEEQERPQPFEVDLDLEVDLRRAGRSDDLADTVDYGAVQRRSWPPWPARTSTCWSPGRADRRRRGGPPAGDAKIRPGRGFRSRTGSDRPIG